jgi:glycosyltransferase involved in cell wall biosynthesis
MVEGVSVIVSTYNQPEWLEKVLWGLSIQDHTNFEIVIADDGSTNDTARAIERIRGEIGLRITHVWQEDNGFRKPAILNKAIVASGSPYLIFTDGDCIPRRDFVTVHAQFARPGWMLSGGYFKLPMDISRAITRDDIVSGRATDPRWLVERGLRGGPLALSKITARGTAARILNAITPTKATWNGHNSSGWKQDILAVNGFDERMEYGGEDREMGERLMNAGVKARQIRYSAICVHLDHSRGYRSEEALRRNLEIRRRTVERGLTWTDFGIVKGPRPAAVQEFA